MRRKRSLVFWFFKIIINPILFILAFFFENGNVLYTEQIEAIEKKMKEKLWLSLLIKGILIIVTLLLVLIIGLVINAIFL